MANNYIPCATVVNITMTWPSVTSNDIEKIRHIVMEKYFPAPERIEDIVQQLGHAFQEMNYLHLYLNNRVIGNEKQLFEEEMWYLTEWLQRNRVNYEIKGKPIIEYDVKSLSKYFSDKLIWLIDEKKDKEIDLMHLIEG